MEQTAADLSLCVQAGWQHLHCAAHEHMSWERSGHLEQEPASLFPNNPGVPMGFYVC